MLIACGSSISVSVFSANSFASNGQFALLESQEEGKFLQNVPDARVYLGTTYIRSGNSTDRATTPILTSTIVFFLRSNKKKNTSVTEN